MRLFCYCLEFIEIQEFIPIVSIILILKALETLLGRHSLNVSRALFLFPRLFPRLSLKIHVFCELLSRLFFGLFGDVRIDIHCGLNVSMAETVLHFLDRCARFEE